MNILVPDSWLRKFLITKATPEKLKECLSLCGPTIERIYTDSGEPVYDIEITTNRPDAMSVFGIAREASVILPKFKIPAKLIDNPYLLEKKYIRPTEEKPIHIETDSVLNPRWTSIILDNVYATESPKWMQDLLTKAGIRSINTVVDVTNYLMISYGQPCHAFDYDRIGKKNGVPWMKLRASKKGETLKTLDGKLHKLAGEDIVIEDGTGKLMDLCGIMGGESSAITKDSVTIILFTQTYEPVHIRKTMMKLSHRTDAGSLFEKGTDTELVLPTLLLGIELLQEIAGGKIASPITDIYPKPYKPNTISCSRTKLDTYIGTKLESKQTKEILANLGFNPILTDKTISVTVPSYRRDVQIDVDIIEEVARIYGYHNIPNRLPEGEMPLVTLSPVLSWEKEIKTRLRDWGYTELITYSMISEELMDIFEFDKEKGYKITNPLSDEWVYMRPHLFPTTISAAIQNINTKKNLKVFELSMAYEYKKNDLPHEKPTLIVIWQGEKFFEAKGLAQALFSLFGIDFDTEVAKHNPHTHHWYTEQSITVGEYGSLGVLNSTLLTKLNAKTPMTRLYLDIEKIVRDAHPQYQYIPIPKHPASSEDFAFIVPDRFAIGPLITALKKAHPMVKDVTLLDVHENSRTLHVIYQDTDKNLTSEDVAQIRKKLITLAEQSFGVSLKTSV